MLARTVREVETAVRKGSVLSSTRTKFQVVALLAREERARVMADQSLGDARRAEELKRLDGIATILATSAASQPSLFTALAEDAELNEHGRRLRRELLQAAGYEVEAEPEPEEPVVTVTDQRAVVPRAVISRRLANPFLVPDFSVEPPRTTGRLSDWELLGPLFRSFEYGGGGAVSCMELPDATVLKRPGVRAPQLNLLMKHQAEMVAAASQGHRTFLLADEPGLGKTAQALLAAQAAEAYPLLVVVPNVVKTNWSREAALWTPNHKPTVIHGNGENIDGFADIVVVNYEILDRHVGWLGDFGFRGMVVDEAHFIKNESSQRSQHVLQIAQRIRTRVRRPLMMALTGTPLINDIEDFRMIWQFLGWIDKVKPLGQLMEALEETGLTPADPGFLPAARRSVIAQGIVRRRKVDVAADIPARRIADIPVELDDVAARSIKDSERVLAQRLVKRYHSALEARRGGPGIESLDGIDHELVRRVAGWEREDDSTSTENVFGMMRRIGQAKAELAADYAAQLVRNVGKVVFFAKHVDVMDSAEELFTKRGIKFTSIRGNQGRAAREKAIDGFTNDPEVEVVVCSLTAAGVGLNLQVASNLVLAELSWTDAEQTQAIDRVHRIGQSEPVTAWRVIATQTIDTRIAELIGQKAGLAARALDGAEEETAAVDVQLEALVALLTDALEKELAE